MLLLLFSARSSVANITKRKRERDATASIVQPTCSLSLSLSLRPVRKRGYCAVSRPPLPLVCTRKKREEKKKMRRYLHGCGWCLLIVCASSTGKFPSLVFVISIPLWCCSGVCLDTGTGQLYICFYVGYSTVRTSSQLHQKCS